MTMAAKVSISEIKLALRKLSSKQGNTMQDENGVKLSEKEIIETALYHISEACCFLFELESPAGQAAAFMADSLLKYTNVVYNGDSPIRATCDYNAYEEEVSERKNAVNEVKNRLKEIDNVLRVIK